MIKQYLAHLELRIQTIEKLLGNTEEFKEAEIKDVRDGINEVVSKLHKDNSRKFERIKKVIERYSEIIDFLPTADKITLVHTQLEEISQIANQLDRIEKLLPALNTDHYLKHRENYHNFKVLNTCSQVEETISQKIAVKAFSEERLVNLQSQHRKSINELAELNGLIVRNLSAKLQALSNRKLKETAA